MLAVTTTMSKPEATQASHTTEPRPQSQAGSSATSRSGASPDWKQFVGWDGKIRPIDDVVYDQLPEVKKLRELNKESLTVPAWLAKIESPEWAAYYKYTRRLQPHAKSLANAVSGGRFTLQGEDKEKDQDLSFHIHESLPFILHISCHTRALRSHGTIQPKESDRRHSVDTLGSLVWDLQSGEHIIYRTERKLAIPCPPGKPGKPEHTGEVQPDACAFIYIPGIAAAETSILTALSCLSTGMDFDYALHWVTEYKRHHNELASKGQVVEGLVSALYQRRALGFPNHFVFGTAHHSQTTLEVLAATWVRSDEARPEVNKHQEPCAPRDQHRDTTGNVSRGDNTAGSEPQTTEDAKIESAVPPEDQANDPPINSLQGDDTTSGTPNDAHTTPDVKDVKKYNKIVVYSMAKYQMTSIGDMMRLYLLMRKSLGLAQQYRTEIVNDGSLRVEQLSTYAEELYQWPPPPRPKSDRGAKRRRTGGSECSNPLGPTPEDACEGSDYESDSEELESLSDASPTRRVVGEG
ncbi:unnamed protein product [Rhizoctonia solani]|uniref:Uncharacterized protein n=1 Tax=Rhizoctonia solani TaxID=456999 RepID=A0A8H3A3B4_9AGAM|nr:unnamed protein product [Rhizoctonia solani]